MSAPTMSPHASASPPPRLMRAALEAASAGHYVFPLWPRSKRPAVEHDWESAATRSPEMIRQRWAHIPYNVGIACDPSGLYVLDLDQARGHEPPEDWAGARHGHDVLARLADAAGEPFPDDTYTVRTPSGGLHLYFQAPEEPELRSTVARLGWRIDTRGAGGYIVAAGSARPDGYYTALNNEPIAVLPQWLITRLTPPPLPTPSEFVPRTGPHTVDELARTSAYLARVTDNVARAEPGQRHNTLVRAAFSLGRLVAAEEITEQQARAALTEAAAAHTGIDGWTTTEAEHTIADGLAAGAHHPRRLTDPS